MRAAITAAVCGGMLWTVGSIALAGEPLPADPTGKPNQMVTACMEKQDPAMNKDDALKACQDKTKQGIKVDKPKKPEPKKPEDSSPGK